MNSAAKVGLLVVVFLGLAFAGLNTLGRSLFAKKPHVFFAELPDAGGVVTGTKVTMAGVRIGTVSKVSLLNPKLARLDLAIDAEQRIPMGSKVLLPASLIGFGDSSIQVVPPEILTNEALPPGAVMAGIKGNPLDAILPEGRETVKELTATLKAARTFISDGDMKKSVSNLTQTANTTVTQFGNLAARTNALIDQNKSALGDAVADARLSMSEIRQASQAFAKLMTDGKLQSKSIALLDELQRTTAKAEKLVSNINDFVSDPQLKANLDATLASAANVAKKGETIADNTEKMTKNGEVLSQKAIQLADDAHEIALEAKQVVQKINALLGKSPKSPVAGPVTAEMDITREADPRHLRTDFDFAIPLRGSSLHFGVYDAFESNRLNLQLAKPFGSRSDYRLGVYAGKPGLGVDYWFAPGTSLVGNLFDLNEPRFDMRLSHEFGGGLIGWLGLDRVFKDNVPSIGIGIRK